MKVAELMMKDVVTTDPDNDVAAVADLMLDRSVGCVIVLSENGVAGLITDRDMLNCLRSAHDAGLCAVSGHMSSPLVTVEPQEDLVKAAALMTEHNIKRLPVVSTAGLVGILSFSDIAGFLHENAATLVPDLESLAVLIKAGMLHRRS
jgi:CBS domain-containing protein